MGYSTSLILIFSFPTIFEIYTISESHGQQIVVRSFKLFDIYGLGFILLLRSSLNVSY